MQMCAIGIPGIAQSADEFASPHPLSRAHRYAALLQMNVVKESVPGDFHNYIVTASKLQSGTSRSWRLKQRRPIRHAIAGFPDDAIRSGEDLCSKPNPIRIRRPLDVTSDSPALCIEADEVDCIPLRYRHSARLRQDAAPMSRTMCAGSVVREPQAGAQRRPQDYGCDGAHLRSKLNGLFGGRSSLERQAMTERLRYPSLRDRDPDVDDRGSAMRNQASVATGWGHIRPHRAIIQVTWTVDYQGVVRGALDDLQVLHGDVLKSGRFSHVQFVCEVYLTVSSGDRHGSNSKTNVDPSGTVVPVERESAWRCCHKSPRDQHERQALRPKRVDGHRHESIPRAVRIIRVITN